LTVSEKMNELMTLLSRKLTAGKMAAVTIRCVQPSVRSAAGTNYPHPLEGGLA